MFRRLIGEHLATELIESPGPGSGRQSVRRPDRFVSEKGPDPILDGNRAGRDLATQQISRRVLKLATVGTLRILENHQSTPRALTADEHTPFRSMARRRFSGFHGTHSDLFPTRERPPAVKSFRVV
jgi:hypothetical protein